MQKLPVLDKIPCLFEVEPLLDSNGNNVSSDKRVGAIVLRATNVRDEAKSAFEAGVTFTPTLKIDGTSCYVKENENNVPTLYMRRDRKLDKKTGGYKSVPKEWFPTGTKQSHWIGWLPVNVPEIPKKAKGECKWHCQGFVDQNTVRTVKNMIVSGDTVQLEYETMNLTDLVGKTLELIGPKIQCNPHNSVEYAYYVHGSLEATCFKTENLPTVNDMIEYMNKPEMKFVEGIVWHCSDNKLYKVHRGHLGLQWK